MVKKANKVQNNAQNNVQNQQVPFIMEERKKSMPMQMNLFELYGEQKSENGQMMKCNIVLQ